MRKSRVTSRDVAEIAGVSYNTVSLVVRDSPLVAPATKVRVQEAIAQLGYQPNAAAAALRSSQSKTLGYLLWREPEALMDEEVDVFHNRLSKAIVDCAQEHDYYVLQNTFIDAQRSLSLLQSGRIDGLLIDLLIPHEVVEILIANQVPLVLVGRDCEDPSISWVKADELSGAYQATNHLLKLKHCSIALLTIDMPGHPIVFDREQGFLRALEDAGVPFDPAYRSCGFWTFESGYEQCQRLLRMTPRPTAIFAMNELMAVGCLQGAQDLGLHVPRDVAIVTVEDSFWVNYVRPQLTAVHVPMYEVGRRATEALLSLIEHPTAPPQHIVVPTTFVTRDSSVRRRVPKRVAQKSESM